MAIDYQTPKGQIRLLISDVDETNLLLTDEQLDGYLSLNPNVYRASAMALRTIAASEVLVSKVLRMQNGTTTDGAKVSAELRTLADELDAIANAADRAVQPESVFEFIPLYETPAEAAEQGIIW